MFNTDNKYRIKEIEAEEGAEFILASLKIITWEEYEEHSEQRQQELEVVNADYHEGYYEGDYCA